MAREKGMGNLQREKSGRWTMRVVADVVHKHSVYVGPAVLDPGRA